MAIFWTRAARCFLFATLLCWIPLFGQQATDVYNGNSVAANQVIVRFRAATPALVQQFAQIIDADQVRQLGGTTGPHLFHSRSKAVGVLVPLLAGTSAADFVEPDYILHSIATPNDPNFSSLWGLHNNSKPGADISAQFAWDISTGSNANVIGVVDSGVDYNHPDLAANIWSAPTAVTVNLSFGSITCPAGSHGFNAITRTCNPMDDHGHGTHVSGTIGAVGNNSAGVVGVNWKTQIMGLKFLDSTGNGSTSDAIDAMEYAIQVKAAFAGTGTPVNVRVFSNSWGGSGFSQSLLNEINKANANDVLFVAAAGNSATNDDTSPTYPASFQAPNMVTVAATDINDALASFSSFGLNTVHLGAPGVSILSTYPNAAYAYLSGTSMATPHVSGAAMLVLSACSLTTAALKATLLNNVDAIPALTGKSVTGGRLNVNKAIRSCAGNPPSTGTAAFIKTDVTTLGNWKGAYGADGHNIIGDTVSYPSYVTVTPAGNSTFTWANSTNDVRGLLKANSSTDRVATGWYTPGLMTVDLNFKDASNHQVALYAVDWDAWGGGRSERIDILDVNNTQLDTRSLSSFGGGVYLVWNFTGHVVIRITNTNTASNALMFGLLFGPGGASPPPPPPPNGTAAFVKTDTTTLGNWKGAYGADGYNVIGDGASYPAYVTATPSGNASYTWANSTSDVRGLLKVNSATDRIASAWYSFGAMTVDLNFKDTNSHQVALYTVDWDGYNGGRAERIDILDGNNTQLDTRSLSGFGGGVYVVWNFTGHVVIRITNTNTASNALLFGLLFGPGSGSPPPPPPPNGTAAFVKTDTTTLGNWKGAYGADGYNVIGDGVSYPAYVTATPSGNASYTWANSTSDVRALLKVNSTTDRIASAWYSFGAMTIDLNFKDTNSHQVALYTVDWDGYNGGRAERIDILDGNNTQLDTRSLSSFGGGVYLVWNFTGHVVIRITNTNGASNALLFGLLFGPGSGSPPPPPPPNGTAVFVKTDTTTLGNWKGVYGVDGYNVIGDGVSYPAYVTATPSGNASYTWANSTSDVRGLLKVNSTTDRIASAWYSFGVMTVDLNFNDTNSHQVALYTADWDGYNGGRSQRIDILDGNNNPLDSHSLASFGGGVYLVWNFTGHVVIRITNTNAASNALMFGLLFGPGH